jgi:hypothetical protein
VNEMGKWLVGWLAVHGVTALWFFMALFAGYIVGLAWPLYCASCRRHMTAREAFRSRFHQGGPEKEK